MFAYRIRRLTLNLLRGEQAMGRNVHVVRDGKQWAVKKEGASKPSSEHRTQENARKAAVRIAKEQKSDVVIHGRGNRIVDRDSYGGDPHPPKDMKH